MWAKAAAWSKIVSTIAWQKSANWWNGTTTGKLMIAHVKANAPKGDAAAAVKAIDDFGWKQQWMMNVGDKKGLILDQALAQAKPKLVLELGTFLGYSSTRIAANTSADTRIITVEMDPDSADIAAQLHEYAGVAPKITLLRGKSSDFIPSLQSQYGFANGADLIFIDHWKDAYLPDIKLLEKHGIVRKGTVVVADNVIMPGAPDYLEYVQKSDRYTTKLEWSKIEYSEIIDDAVAISEAKY